MKGFAYGLSFAFLSALFLATGIGHALGLDRFRAVIREHGVVPSAAAAVVAIVVAGLELALGVALARAVLWPDTGPPDAVLASASAVAGFAFLVYLRRLLRQPVRAKSCGCSVLASPLTHVSLAPSVGVLIASTVAIGTALLEGAVEFSTPGDDPLRLLSACWGATLAALVLVLPAVVAPRITMGRA